MSHESIAVYFAVGYYSMYAVLPIVIVGEAGNVRSAYNIRSTW